MVMQRKVKPAQLRQVGLRLHKENNLALNRPRVLAVGADSPLPKSGAGIFGVIGDELGMGQIRGET